LASDWMGDDIAGHDARPAGGLEMLSTWCWFYAPFLGLSDVRLVSKSGPIERAGWGGRGDAEMVLHALRSMHGIALSVLFSDLGSTTLRWTGGKSVVDEC